MKIKKTYITPVVHIVIMQQRAYLLNTSVPNIEVQNDDDDDDDYDYELDW